GKGKHGRARGFSSPSALLSSPSSQQLGCGPVLSLNRNRGLRQGAAFARLGWMAHKVNGYEAQIHKPTHIRGGSRGRGRIRQPAEASVRYTPKTLDEVRRCLGGCAGEVPVEIEHGVPVTAKTVAQLRALAAWPPGDWVLDVPVKGDQRSGVVRIEWPSYTSL